MKTTHHRLLLTAILSMGAASQLLGAEPADARETLDAILQAYNAGDAKAFWAHASEQSKAIATEQTFEVLYTKESLPRLGKYLSRTLRDAESVVTGEFLLLVYDAKCEKGTAKLSVNMTREGGKWRLMQLGFDR